MNAQHCTNNERKEESEESKREGRKKRRRKKEGLDSGVAFRWVWVGPCWSGSRPSTNPRILMLSPLRYARWTVTISKEENEKRGVLGGAKGVGRRRGGFESNGNKNWGAATISTLAGWQEDWRPFLSFLRGVV